MIVTSAAPSEGTWPGKKITLNMSTEFEVSRPYVDGHCDWPQTGSTFKPSIGARGMNTRYR